MAEAKDNQTKAPDAETKGAVNTTASEPAQAPKKSTKRKPKEDPRGTLMKFGNVKLYVKG